MDEGRIDADVESVATDEETVVDTDVLAAEVDVLDAMTGKIVDVDTCM